MTQKRDLLKRVRLGASLFQILRNEEAKKQQESEKERDKASSKMQIRPLIESDDEVDGQLSEDNNLFNELCKRVDPRLNSQMSDVKVTEEDEIAEREKSPALKNLEMESSFISCSSLKNSGRPLTYHAQSNGANYPK